MVNPIKARLWIAALALAIYWLALFTATHLPSRAAESVRLYDKAAHFGAYFGLAVLLAWVISGARPRIVTYVIALALLACYGAIDEGLQTLVPGRTPDTRDWLADMAGATCGLIFHCTGVWVHGAAERESRRETNDH